ncbi:MAG: putative baseplate assembly protein [Caldilineaceae bacterium]|nr:putative baseplate assembly protein [Caldilineaceae bacterium]
MSTSYFCHNERRRQALQGHATLNGIDYLEVLHSDAPLGSPPQRTLLVHFVNPLTTPLTGDNLRIEGSERITALAVRWADWATNADTLLAGGQIIPTEHAFLAALPDAAQILVVRTAVVGDFSPYRLRLVHSPTQLQPPTGLDPILAEIEFSFKVECPSEFDCQVIPACPPVAVASPTIDYLAKDYASLRKVMLDRLAVIMPEWQARTPVDVGITLVELLAYAGDYLSYFQDAAATEAYLDTARRRVSLRRHARLLDYPLHDGVNARTWVAFGVTAAGDGLHLPQYDPISKLPTRLLTQLPLGPVIAAARLPEVLGNQETAVFELMHDIRLYAAHNEIHFYTWGDEACCLPQGATRATLADDLTARLRLCPGDVLILMEKPQSAGEGHGICHAVRLTQVYPAAVADEQGERTPAAPVMDELLGQPIVAIEWADADALPFALCLSNVQEGRLVTDLSVALGNVTLADHGLSITGEVIAPASNHRRYRPRLQATLITYAVTYAHAQARTQPATALLKQDPRAALPAVTLQAGHEQWTPQRDLLASDRFATEFVVEMENDGHGYLRFGDGTLGRDPAGRTFQVDYRVGNGPTGNIGADAIAHIVPPHGGLADAFAWIRNPLPATGGTAPETNEDILLYAPQAFRTQERAVTEADYAAVVERHPAVQKAMATRRWTGSWYTLFVTVDRKGGLPVDAAFAGELRRWIERFRLAGHDVEIDAPRFVPLEIVMAVCVRPGYFRSDVKAALLTAFSNRQLATGQLGFFHPDNFTFGQPVYLSPILATAMAVPGVQWVAIADQPNPLTPTMRAQTRFQRWGQSAHGEIAAGVINLARLEIARLENDPNRPEQGKIDFLMQGGR